VIGDTVGVGEGINEGRVLGIFVVGSLVGLGEGMADGS